jgi:Ca-activated chloride channel family protein
MVAELAAVGAALLILLAECLHARRVRRVAALAFGPTRRPARWAWLAPPLRVAAVAGLAWGLATLLLLSGQKQRQARIRATKPHDLVLVLDVSPSMRLADAGPQGNQSRRKRALALLESFFARAPMHRYRTTIVAVWTAARPVVLQTTDPEVIHNILDDLPLEHAFEAGPTNLVSGIEEAGRISQSWSPGSTTLIVVSDGDTVPATGLPKLPPSIAHVVVVGVGDPKVGSFIAGHMSRQDVSSLRQLATQLNGTYHDGNDKHLSTNLISEVTISQARGSGGRLTRSEYALAAVTAGASILALLPLLLHLAGTSWRPGVRSVERR